MSLQDMKKVQRRERNKLAAARCRKRRLDLTTQLQVGIFLSTIINFLKKIHIMNILIHNKPE